MTTAAEDTAAVYAALRKRFPVKAGEWGLLFEVGDATGYKVRGHADAVAMSLWPSRGLTVHGIEVKSTRADWLRERDNPMKAEVMSRRCDYWWLATAHDDVVKDGELPDTWGLMVLRKGKLVTVKDAPQRPGVEVGRDFFAAVFRASQRTATTAEVDAMVAQKVAAAREQWASAYATDLARARSEMKTLRETEQAFEREAGVSIRWAVDHVAKAVKLAMRVGTAHEELQRLEGALRRQLDALVAARAELVLPPALVSAADLLDGPAEGARHGG